MLLRVNSAKGVEDPSKLHIPILRVAQLALGMGVDGESVSAEEIIDLEKKHSAQSRLFCNLCPLHYLLIMSLGCLINMTLTYICIILKIFTQKRHRLIWAQVRSAAVIRTFYFVRQE